MSGCPENDLHSVYLDGEMPESFVKAYESHIASCKKCSARLEILRSIKNEFKEDETNIEKITPDIDESFERLKARMSYAKVCKKTVYEFPKISSALKYGITAVAAALVVTFVIPLRMQKSNSAVANQNQQAHSQSSIMFPPNYAEMTGNHQAGYNFGGNPYYKYAQTASSNEHGAHHPQFRRENLSKRRPPEFEASDYYPLKNFADYGLERENRRMPPPVKFGVVGPMQNVYYKVESQE